MRWPVVLAAAGLLLMAVWTPVAPASGVWLPIGGTQLRFAGGRFRWPTKQVASTTGGGNLAVISDLSWVTPAYDLLDLQFLFPAYYCDINGVSGPEKLVGNNLGLRYAVKIGASGSWSQGSIGGSLTPTLVDGTNNWTETGQFSPQSWIPAGTQCSIRTIASVANGQNRPGGMRNVTSGTGTGPFILEAARKDAVVANLEALLTNPAPITSNVSGIDLDIYGPAAVIGTARTGHRSILILGDSIDYSRSGSASAADDASNNQGMWSPAFQAAGWGHCTPAFQGVKLQFESASDATASLVRRAAAFTMLPQLPFDTLVAGTLRNDTGATAFATVQGWFNNYTARVRSLFPGIRLGHATPCPFTTGTFTTLAGQTVATGASSPLGPMFQMRDYIQALAGGRLDFSVSRAILGAKAFNASDPEDKWRTDTGSGGGKDTTAWTSDGTHPNDLAQSTAAAAILSQINAGVI